MWRFILDLLSYSSFVCVLYVISYSNHNSDACRQVQHLNQLFLNPRNFTDNFSRIITINEYWEWLQGSFVNNIFVGNWYNGQPINDSRGYLSDKTNRLLGWATMRQLRVRSDTCHVKSIIRDLIPICYDGYSGSTEETRSFSPGWSTNETAGNFNSSINQAFQYQTSEELDTYIYIGEYATYRSGGYVYEFRDSLSQIRNDLFQLHQLGWIDRQTRAVLIQLNLYNPNVPLYTSATLLIEILPSSGIFPSARFEPLNFDIFKSIFQIICVFIYFIFIIYFMIVEIYSLIRLKKFYFRQVWSYIELGIIVCSWTSVGIHIWRMNEITRITNLFSQTEGNVYVNLQLVAYINDLFSFLMGFCCFFGTLKFLLLYHYDRRLALLSNTLKRASRELILFLLMFAIVYMAFLTLFYLQFNSLVWNFSTLLQTAQMLFEMLLLKFDARLITSSSSFLGPLYFSLFIFFVVFISMNMFISIIIDNFRLVRADVNKIDPDEQDVFISLIKKFHRWCGYENKVHVEMDNVQVHVINVTEMRDPIQRLLNKLDHLTIYVNRHYGNVKVRKS